MEIYSNKPVIVIADLIPAFRCIKLPFLAEFLRKPK